MRSLTRSLLVAFFVLGFVSSSHAQDLLPRDNGIFDYHHSPRYRGTESHPLRTLAYIAHPVGWIAREALYRPWSAFAASTSFTRSFFGFREPFDYREADCFDPYAEIPDCTQLAPYNAIGGEPAMMEDEGAMMMESEQQVFFPDVNFEFDRAELNDLGKGRVRQIAQLLANVPNLQIVVEGHTDYKGTDEYNMDLGTRRAQSVGMELGELGIDPSRVSTVSYGEARPIFAEEEDWARAVNRRVQFSVGSAEMADSGEAME